MSKSKNDHVRSVTRDVLNELFRLMNDPKENNRYCRWRVVDDTSLTGYWMAFNESIGRWEVDQSSVYLAIRRAVDNYVTNAYGGKKEVEKIAERIQTHSFYMSVLNESKYLSTISDNIFDQVPYYLSTPNEVIDLRDGTRFRGRASDHITDCTLTRPKKLENCDRNAICEFVPNFVKLLRGLTNSQSSFDYLLRYLGYCLTGETREQKFVFLHGQMGTGKSTLTELMVNMLGSYAWTVNADNLRLQTTEKHSQWLYKIKGKRLVSTNEPRENSRWNTGLLNPMVSGEHITANAMRKDDESFRSIAKLLITGNHAPSFPSGDGVARRLIAFRVDKPIGREDYDLMSKLHEEQPIILALLINEAREYYREGLLDVPHEIAAENKSFMLSMDTILQFISDDCTTLDPDNHIGKVRLYDAYRRYCKRNQITAKRKGDFIAYMRSKGFKEGKWIDYDVPGSDTRVHAWEGIRLALK